MRSKTDAEIKRQVLEELAWDRRVDETDVGVEVEGGIVTLTGTVSSWAKRIAAQEAAHRVAAVRDVANDVQVDVPGGELRTDTEIAASVRRTLEWDVFVDDERVRSTVSQGWVTLEGEVDSWGASVDAEQAIRNLAGVRGVRNELQVVPAPVHTEDLQQAIASALERHAEREARRIDVDVRNDCVSLRGVVDSWREKRAVVGAARGTPGVRVVEDHLRVLP